MNQRMLERLAVGVARFVQRDDEADVLLAYANPAWLALTGLPPSAVGQRLSPVNLIHPDDREVYKLAIAGSRHSEKAISFTLRYLRPDGSVAWGLNQSNGLREGDTTHRMVTLEDVTESMQDHLERQRATRHLAQAQAASKLGFWWADVNDFQSHWDVNTCAIYGLPSRGPDTVVSYEEWAALVHPDDLASIQRERGVRANPLPEHVTEFRVIWPTGAIRWVRSSVFQKFNDQGQLLERWGYNFDITAEKEREEELRRSRDALASSQARLRDGLRAAGLGYFQADKSTGESFWDEVTQAIYGLPVVPGGRQVRWAEFAACVHPDDLPLVARGPGDRVRTEALHQIEFRVVWPDGSVHWVESSVFNQPQSAWGFNRDITERKAYEARLIQAREDALAGEKARAEFLSVISHEIRTPLNGVMGMLQLLEMEDALPDQARTYVKRTYESSQLLLAVLNDVLDYSSLSEGRLPIKPAPMRLDALGAFVQWMKLAWLQNHEVDLIVQVSRQASSAQVVADELRLRQILLNLVNNAMKFTHHGHVMVTVDALPAALGAVDVEISVSDTGIGMSDDTQARLFQPFMQADMSNTRRYGGTGLGLAIVKSLVEAMNGSIQVRSALGRGSSFKVQLRLPRAAEVSEAAPAPLPLAPTELDEVPRLQALSQAARTSTRMAAALAAPAAMPESAAARPAALAGSLRGVRVLLVEDDAANAEFEQLRLLRCGAIVTRAAQGREALALLKARPDAFDVVLLDLQMPELDGWEVAQTLRRSAQPALRTLPILALSGNLMNQEPQRAREAGMNDFIAKPASVEALVQAIRGVVPSA